VVIIKEFLPNPEGKDTLGEYIILKNEGETSINLFGWKLKDKSGKTFRLNGILDSNQELKLPYSETKITLNNNGEVLELIDKNGTIADELSYIGQAKSGMVIKNIKEITPEIREEFLENLTGEFMANTSSFPFFSFWITLIFTGLILALVSLWIVKKFE
jgi:hypothetical protein